MVESVRQQELSQIKAKKRWLTERDLEAIGLCSARTAQKWRLFGKGPRFYRAGGRVLYDADEVDAWIRSHASGPEAA